MILRNLRSSRLILQPTTLYKRNIIRLTSSNSNVPPPGNEKDTENPLPKLQHASSPEISSHHAIDHAQETPVHKTLKATKAYLSKIQGDMKPHLEPYIDKLNNASQQLKRLTSDVSDTKEALQRASRALNELTGYDQIDAVKRKVTNQATLFETTRDQVQSAKRAYESAIETRSSTQRGINELLQRKHLWTGDDVTKFTELYRLEHQHSQAEAVAKEQYQASEKQMDREYMELARSIMERYHEEQLWSDKIRSVSTYGTWALMVVNLLLFVAVQTVFEPRKRKRLTDRFEELLVSKVDEEEEKFRGVFETLNDQDRMLMNQQVAFMQTLNRLVEHPLFDEDTLESLKMPATAIEQNENVLQPEKEEEKPWKLEQEIPYTTNKELSNEELQTLLLLCPANFDTEDTPVLAENVTKQKTDDTLTLSKTNLVLYSIESAVAGGLATALAVYFFR